MPTDSYWPLDRAMCAGVGCDRRRTCSRFVWHELTCQDPRRRTRQNYVGPDPETCDIFVPEEIADARSIQEVEG